MKPEKIREREGASSGTRRGNASDRARILQDEVLPRENNDSRSVIVGSFPNQAVRLAWTVLARNKLSEALSVVGVRRRKFQSGSPPHSCRSLQELAADIRQRFLSFDREATS
ncbi:hypothetical protein RRG08_004551 [Elysia crispata]|uniref:Uncharacterized protein n=1 Tax=Elysia crispata TaxID=231223 RepID=A0AAE1BBC6_9GAST|nr:hypothetical protein RRG08_004551 [Elysia crispata]